jgi:transposase
MKIKDTRSLPAIAQEDLRKKAVKAVKEGKRPGEVAAILGVTPQNVRKWVNQYDQGGAKALKAKRKGRPKGGKLHPWQQAQIAKMVTNQTPEQLQLPYYLWTREAVGQLIEQRFEIKLSVWTIGRYLSKWGFTPQKPVRRAYEKNPKAVQNWLKKDYPLIQKQAKKEKALIYWGDEMGLRSDDAVGRSYGRIGKTPIIGGTGQRFGCNVISAINNGGQLHFMVFKSRFNNEVFVGFIQRLLRQIKRKLFLIVDGHPVHHAIEVKNWTAKHLDQIHLYFLPGYSPELNPDEMLNNDVKSNAVGRKRAKNQQELVANTRSYLRSRQHQPRIVRRYFQEEHVRYAAFESI